MSDYNSTKPEKNSKLIYFLSNILSENFKTLVLTNLLFDVPLIAAAGIIALISYLIGGVYTFVVLLAIPLLAPFSAGIFYIVRNISKGEKAEPFKQFKRGIKDNAVQFLIQGVVHYIVFSGFYVSFEFYRGYLPSPLAIAALVMSVIAALIYLFMCFNMGMMTVTVKLKSKDIFKNALLLSFIALVQNIKTLLGLLFIFAVLMSVLMTIPSMLAAACLLSAVVLFILPTLIFLVMGYDSYSAVEAFVINSKAEKKSPKEAPKPVIPQLTIEELEQYTEGDPNEYIYVDGKMMKRASVVKLLESMKKKDE